MGLEVAYQAIPTGCGLIELARVDADIAESIAFVPSWFRRAHGQKLGREHEDAPRLWKWCCELAALYPRLRTHNCYLDRRWDKLHYLLSATRRGEQSSPEDRTIDCAFGAGEILADGARGGQGVPVQYMPPGTARAIAAIVEHIDHVVLARHYEPVRMEAAHVYKFDADRADAAEWRWIVQTFDEFRQFFVETALRGDDDVIVVKD